MSGPYELEAEIELFGETRAAILIYETDPEDGLPDIMEVRTKGERSVWSEAAGCLVVPVYDVLPLCPAWLIQDFRSQILDAQQVLTDDCRISDYDLRRAERCAA
ncbi:MAG: hypothetical protein IPK09_00740 [Candidatus Competibacteraceae bacterium]|jgi:hypothetical protein|nr:hypothetical protein [Candidatus Competibacteraceae bacterium]